MTESSITSEEELPALGRRSGLGRILDLFSPAERLLFWVLLSVLVISGGTLFARANALILVEVPTRGGSIVEGVVGSPRFINPLLSVSDSDRDLTSLVYSGLMRATPEGNLIPDLAEDYTISEDGQTYTFTLRDDALFHDGMAVTADDVAFTVAMTQDPTLKSPRRASWDGVIVEKVDERTIRFTLPQAYAPFLENTTLGILPEHLWEGASSEEFPFSQLNIEPIGSGPFKIDDIKRNSSGLPISYELSAFEDYTLGIPYLESVTLKFYPNEEELVEAYRQDQIGAINSIAPEKARELGESDVRIETSPLPRIFGVFFNQNQAEIFTNPTVREALSLAAPKEQIIEEILEGYGTAIESPIPPGLLLKDVPPKQVKEYEDRVAKARELLVDDGWVQGEETGALVRETKEGVERLSFSLSTSNTPELKAVAGILVAAWKNIGVEVDMKFFETSDLNQNVIRSRNYDALLFGEIVGRELDLFSFWHSSQMNDPGLNIALYANISADSLLAAARANPDREEREALYREFTLEVEKDMPAIFLYAPDFIYVVPEKVRALRLGSVTTSGERFLNIHEWYIETESVWPFLIQE